MVLGSKGIVAYFTGLFQLSGIFIDFCCDQLQWGVNIGTCNYCRYVDGAGHRYRLTKQEFSMRAYPSSTPKRQNTLKSICNNQDFDIQGYSKGIYRTSSTLMDIIISYNFAYPPPSLKLRVRT